MYRFVYSSKKNSFDKTKFDVKNSEKKVSNSSTFSNN